MDIKKYYEMQLEGNKIIRKAYYGVKCGDIIFNIEDENNRYDEDLNKKSYGRFLNEITNDKNIYGIWVGTNKDTIQKVFQYLNSEEGKQEEIKRIIEMINEYKIIIEDLQEELEDLSDNKQE